MRPFNRFADILKRGFKNRFGKLPEAPASASHPIPYSGILPIASSGDPGHAEQVEKTIFDLLERGNLPQAEITARDGLARDPGNAKLLNYLGWIATAAHLPESSLQYFSTALERAPEWELPRKNLAQVQRYLKNRQGQAVFTGSSIRENQPANKFILIKAWGFGFWSDVSHVLGQLLVAELTGRIPIVHWGANSLFWDGVCDNAFDSFFEPVSDWSIRDLQSREFSFWPPKWNHNNLTHGEVNQWNGPFSRVAAVYLLGRHETVLVSDFFTSVFDLKPWIPEGSDLFGLSVDELWMYLIKKYLRPQGEITDSVNRFFAKNLASKNFVAVHARGSDKVLEMSYLEQVNLQYKGVIDKFLATHGCTHVFLMTDDSRLRDYFVSIYGDNIVCTECQRTGDAQGVHYQEDRDRRQLGIEVMVDAYLASKAKAFVGNGFSNPSQIVRYLKAWPQADVQLIGPNMCHSTNVFLHKW